MRLKGVAFPKRLPFRFLTEDDVSRWYRTCSRPDYLRREECEQRCEYVFRHCACHSLSLSQFGAPVLVRHHRRLPCGTLSACAAALKFFGVPAPQLLPTKFRPPPFNSFEKSAVFTNHREPTQQLSMPPFMKSLAPRKGSWRRSLTSRRPIKLEISF